MRTPEERRALVAERVMGWELQHRAFPSYDCWVVGKHGEHIVETIDSWRPLESWADAGRVIERMADLGFTMTFIYGPGGDDVTFYHVEDGRYGFSKGKSAPRHISLAALEALGVEVE